MIYGVFLYFRSNIMNKGKVYIASMNMRGKWASCPVSCMKINVTSAQGKQNKNRRDFSPMTACSYKGYYNFEAYWQSGKVFEGIPSDRVKTFWKSISSPKRRYPNSKGKKVLYSCWDEKDEKVKMSYIESRVKVYVPEYYELVQNREMTLYWKEQVQQGKDVVIYDFDGPRSDQGEICCEELTVELLKRKLHDTRHPFGHGFIVASLIAGIPLNQYIGRKTNIYGPLPLQPI